MLFKRSSLRYAHTTGHTGLTYTSNDGEFILTCGSDGDIRKWSGIDDDDPTSNCLGEFVNCIAHTGDKLIASSDRNTIQRYTFPDLDKDGTLMRFTAPVTCMRILNDWIAAGSEDTMIKVLRNGDIQTERQFEGHAGPVLALDISDLKKVLASVGGDGQLKIWDLDSGAEVKTIDGLARTNSFESAVCYGTPSFEPQQQLTLVYVNGRDIHVLSTDTWELQCTLSDERTSGNYTCCRFSEDGQYLAAGTSAGEISVFDFMRKQVIKSEPPSSECQGITCIAWHPIHNELAYCDATGQLGTLSANKGSAAEQPIVSADLLEDEALDFGDVEFDSDDAESNQILGDDEDNENCVSLEKLKRKVMGANLVNNGASLLPGDDDDNTRTTHSDDASAVVAQSHLKRFKQQVPFQPSSTPSHLEHRYLVWNDVGIVTAHADSGEGSIDVEFHDASVHHSLHIPNYNGHSMASLSATVVALAANDATKIVCIALASSGNKEWSLPLPDCESVEALVATTQLVAVATSTHFLRLFTVLGTQREVLTLPGPVVAMAGHAGSVVIVYHSAASGESQQYLAALLVHTKSMSLRCQSICLPLPAGRQLSWLGFSDYGSPVFSDHMGLLQLYSSRSNCWYPVCDTLKHSQSASNNYFVIGVSERSQIVHAVLCRGTTYPMTNPRPMTQELPIQLPLCDMDVEKSKLEDELVRAHTMAVDDSERRVKETAIKLFALACRSEMEARAKELIETIGIPELLLLACKYATKLGRIHLSDRLYELRGQMDKQQQPEPADEDDTPVVATRTQATTPLSNAASYKLAPKSIEISSSKRAQALKRFALSTATQSSNSTLPSLSGARKSVANGGNISDSQENIFGDIGDSTEPGLLSSVETQHKLLASEKEEQPTTSRSPLNAVNPFASKRKLSDVDFLSSGSTLANKFKMAKK